MAIFGVAYSPLRVSVGMQVTEGVLTQEYDPGASEYAPDRRIRPTAILPVVSVSDPAGLLAGGVANAMLADIYWYEGEASEANVILDSNPDYDIDKTSDNTNRGRITVYKNVPFNQPLTLVFKAVLVDMAGGKVRRKANVMGSVDLTTSTASSSPLVLVQGYPRGNLYNILDQRALKLSAKLMSGTEEIPSAFWWYKKEGTKLTPLEDLDGAKTGELTVPVDYVGRRGKFVAKVQDCRKDLKAVQDAWLDAELEKVREWPRNLVAKQYMMDWNEVQAGITTKGEDSDGEYWKINTIYLRRYVAKDSANDIFQGKIDYQPNVRYSLKVKWRADADYNFFPFAFLFKYTDGADSGYSLKISNTHGELVEDTFVVPDGKSLERISMTLENSGYVRIYDFQLTELHEENLVEDSGEVRITAGADSIYAAALLPIAATFKAGDKLTLSVGEVRNLAGNPDKYSVFLQHPGELMEVSNSKLMAKDSPFVVFTLNDRYDPAQPVRLVMYAGMAGSTAGNDVVFEEVMLVEGEYTSETMPPYVPKWIPAAADLAVEAEGQSLPAGYRPSTQGDTHDGEYDLAVKMPKVATKVVTPWGDDKEVIMIPPGVKLFPARIQVDTPQGTLDNPAEYFSADWGNGLKGMQVLLDAEQIGTGTMVVEPDIYDDLSKARYGVTGVVGAYAKLEDFEDGTRVVAEIDTSAFNANYHALRLINGNRNGVGFMVTEDSFSVIIMFGNEKRSTTSVGNSKMLRRVEFIYNADVSLCKIYIDGVEVPVSQEMSDGSGAISGLEMRSPVFSLLAEIYSPDGTLLHKWDMEGATDDERLADKAVTENKINLSKSTGFKLTPI